MRTQTHTHTQTHKHTQTHAHQTPILNKQHYTSEGYSIAYKTSNDALFSRVCTASSQTLPHPHLSIPLTQLCCTVPLPPRPSLCPPSPSGPTRVASPSTPGSAWTPSTTSTWTRTSLTSTGGSPGYYLDYYSISHTIYKYTIWIL